MQYSLDEIHLFLKEPDNYKSNYTQALLDELVAYLFPESQSEVYDYLGLLPESSNSIRIQLACVHLSYSQETEIGNIDKLLQNIDLASKDYRDLLMAYYL